jgi:hypothetical protein
MATDLAALEYACAFVRPGCYFHVVSRFAGNQPTSLQAIAEAEMQALAEHGSVELVEVLCQSALEWGSDSILMIKGRAGR